MVSLLLRGPLERALVFRPCHERRPHALHFPDARLDVVLGDVPAVPVHHLLQAHDAEQGADHRELAEDPRVQEAHLEGFPGLGPLAVKNVGHGGHADGRDALEGIGLDEVRRLLVKGEGRRIDQPHARLQYGLAVQIVQAQFLFRGGLLLFGPRHGLLLFVGFACGSRYVDSVVASSGFAGRRAWNKKRAVETKIKKKRADKEAQVSVRAAVG